ncbi:MAG TPA: carboxypeptidase-like regulatory domain-containing protein, partial [Candidatus Polarisedimenticolaceae bacterium]|nr:carboxypeptidase-like regulatory domain-containing protein [Candidatus Polarisedimenticolaceae bacterium]
RVARTNAGGEFFVGNLRPGIYHVELSPDNLPIELAPQLRSLNAEVSGAAVTRVDFIVRPEFGIAGRVRDASGAPVSGMHVEILDGSSAVVVTAVTDRFGLFRVDGLPIGSYLLRPRPRDLAGLDAGAVERVVRITDDFLFGQDLTLPVVVESATTDSDPRSG